MMLHVHAVLCCASRHAHGPAAHLHVRLDQPAHEARSQGLVERHEVGWVLVAIQVRRHGRSAVHVRHDGRLLLELHAVLVVLCFTALSWVG